MQAFKKSIEKSLVLPHLSFDERLSKSYIKIVSNTYYLNLRKTAVSLKDDYINKRYLFHNDREAYDIINKIYNKNLKKTRNEVCDFFDIADHANLDRKLMIRLYYYYLPKNNPERIKMDEFNKDVNYIFSKLSLGYKFNVLLQDEKHCKSSHTYVKDMVLDFFNVIENIVEEKDMLFEENSDFLKIMPEERKRVDESYCLKKLNKIKSIEDEEEKKNGNIPLHNQENNGQYYSKMRNNKIERIFECSEKYPEKNN